MHKVFRFLWVILAAGCVYLGGTFYSRWNDNRAFVQRLEQVRMAQDQAFLRAYGGDRLILDFYAVPGILRRGEKAQLCYSVINAKSVRIEPPVENVWPSHSRCVEVEPRKDTEYKLIAEGDKGRTQSATLTIKVR